MTTGDGTYAGTPIRTYFLLKATNRKWITDGCASGYLTSLVGMSVAIQVCTSYGRELP